MMFRYPVDRGSLGAVALAVFLMGCGSAEQPPAGSETATRPADVTLEEGEWPLAFSPDGKTLATMSANRKIRLRDLLAGQSLGEGDASDGTVRHVAFSRDGKRLAVVYDPRRWDRGPYVIQLWDVTADGLLRNARTVEPDVHYSSRTVYGAAFSPDGETVAAGTDKEVIYLWDAGTGKVKRRFQGGVAANYSPDGKTLSAVTHDGLVRRFDPATGMFLGPAEPVRRSDFLYVTHAVFAPDGKRVALGDGWTALVKDVDSNRTLCRLTLPTAAVPLSFSPDGKTLAVGGESGTHFFDTTTGKERAWMKCAGGRGEFLGDGQHWACFDGRSVALHETEAVFAGHETAPGPARTDPPGAPLEAELIANQDTYTLDLEGDTPEDFSTRIQFGEPFPDSPRVNLVLRLRNTGKEAISLRQPEYSPALYLVGVGAMNYPLVMRQTGVFGGDPPERPEPLRLAPGETHAIPVFTLDGGNTGYPFWLLPGDYAIAGSHRAVISPAPKGSYDMGDGYGYVHVQIAPITVKVLAARNPPAPDSVDEAREIRRPPPPGTVIVPKPDDGSAKVWDMLASPVKYPGVENGTPLKDAVEYLNDRYDLDIRLDEAAFDKVGKKRIGETKLGLPPLRGVRLSTVLHVLLDQVDARLEVRGGTAWVLPLASPQSLVGRLRPAPKVFRERLNETVTLKAGIEAGTPLSEALQICSDRFDVCLFLDTRAFERAGVQNIDKRPVTLPPQTAMPVHAVLDQLLSQAGATFIPREDLVIVVPRERE